MFGKRHSVVPLLQDVVVAKSAEAEGKHSFKCKTETE